MSPRGRAEQETPLWHRQWQYPTAADALSRELDERVHDGLDSETRGLLQSMMLPRRLRVERASKSGAQRRRSGCLVPGMWGVDGTRGLNPMEK